MCRVDRFKRRDWTIDGKGDDRETGPSEGRGIAII